MTSEIIKRLQTGLVKDVKPKELNNTAWDTFFQHLENTGLKQLLFGGKNVSFWIDIWERRS
jgi:hypothetical protein